MTLIYEPTGVYVQWSVFVLCIVTSTHEEELTALFQCASMQSVFFYLDI